MPIFRERLVDVGIRRVISQEIERLGSPHDLTHQLGEFGFVCQADKIKKKAVSPLRVGNGPGFDFGHIEVIRIKNAEQVIKCALGVGKLEHQGDFIAVRAPFRFLGDDDKAGRIQV